MKRFSPVAPLAVLLLPLGAASAMGQQPPAQPEMTVDAQMRTAVIDGVLTHLNNLYVFPEKAAEMERAIRQRVARNEYANITRASELADSLTSHLQAVSRDKHLRVRYSHEPLPRPRAAGEGPPPEMRERMLSRMRSSNFGFEKVERLPGNVGYLDLRVFADPNMSPEIDEAAARAMGVLADADALIIDLRSNGGGSPGMVRLLSSYLYGSTPVHLNSLFWREGNRTEEFWTLAEVPGERYGESKPVYVLTSPRTFSGAEEFAYNLKNLKRATIVGETTGGGAHPGGPQRVNEHFQVWIPRGRAINPITRTNWEGTGVEPDVAVPAVQALETAHLAALRTLFESTSDAQRRRELQQAIDAVQRGSPAGG